MNQYKFIIQNIHPIVQLTTWILIPAPAAAQVADKVAVLKLTESQQGTRATSDRLNAF
jgi:hypothetical protein